MIPVSEVPVRGPTPGQRLKGAPVAVGGVTVLHFDRHAHLVYSFQTPVFLLLLEGI
jgi:hypothetical protein